MKPVIRYRSQLLFRKSYKPVRLARIHPPLKLISFRPKQTGTSPRAA